MGTSFCGLCGRALSGRETFCGNCGAPVLASPPTTPRMPLAIPPQSAGRPHERRVWIAAVAGVVVVAGAAVAFALTNGDGESTSDASDPSNAAPLTESVTSEASTVTSGAPLTVSTTATESTTLVTIVVPIVSTTIPAATSTSASATTVAPKPPTTPPHGPVVETRCARPDIDFAAVRAAPGVDQLEVGRIPASTCNVEVYGTSSDGRIPWLQVGLADVFGWSADSNFLPGGG